MKDKLFQRREIEAQHDPAVIELWDRMRSGESIVWVHSQAPEVDIEKVIEAAKIVEYKEDLSQEDGYAREDGEKIPKYPPLHCVAHTAARGFHDLDDEHKQILVTDDMTGESQFVRQAIDDDPEWAKTFDPPLSTEPDDDEEDIGIDPFGIELKHTYGYALNRRTSLDDRLCTILVDWDEALKSKEFILSTLKLRIREYRRTGSFIVLLSRSPNPLPKLKPISTIEMPLPCNEDFKKAIDVVLANVPEEVRPEFMPDTKDKVAQTLLGLTYEQGESALAYVGRRCKRLEVRQLSLYKSGIFNQDGIIEFIDVQDTIDDFGGYKPLKTMIKDLVKTFVRDAVLWGTKHMAPKGLMMYGPPGTGKTMMAQIIATILGLPAVIVNFSRCYDKWVGGTEANVAKLIMTLKAIGPCVIIFDEAEKIFAGTDGGSTSSSDVSQRALAPMLKFMHEPHFGQYIVLTSNKPWVLPDPMVRSGRLDVIIEVNNPNVLSREDIARIWWAKFCNDVNGIDPKIIDAAAIANVTEGFSGADIMNLMRMAFTYGWCRGDKIVNTDTVIGVVSDVCPCSKVFAERQKLLDDWAKTRDTFDADGIVDPKVKKARLAAGKALEKKTKKNSRMAYMY
jgi:hypothetical protein